MEIDEQAGWKIAETEIGEELSRMDRKKFFDRFQFNDDSFIDKDVDAVAGFAVHPL